MSEVRKALEKALKTTQKKSESDAKYRERLGTKAQDLTDAGWESLGEDGQQFSNDVMDAIKKKKPIPDFPDAESDDKPARRGARRKVEEETEAEDDGEAEEEEAEGEEEEESEAEEEAEESEAEESEAKPARRGSRAAKKAPAKKAAKKAPAKKAPAKKAAKAPKEKKVREPSKWRLVKRIIVKDPTISLDKLSAALDKKGIEIAEISLRRLRADTIDTLRALEDEGLYDFG